MKRLWLNLLIVLLVLGVLIGQVFFKGGIENLEGFFRGLDFVWLVVALSFMAAYWLLDALNLHMLVKVCDKKHSFKEALVNTMVGAFFLGVTPFSSGGQPAQIYLLSKSGLGPGVSTSVIITKTMSHSIVVFLIALVSVITKGAFYAVRIPGFFTLFLLGFLVSSLVSLTYILAIYKMEIARKLISFIFSLPRKIKILRRFAKYEKKALEEIELYSNSAQLLKNSATVVSSSIALQTLRHILFLSVPYLIYLSVDIPHTESLLAMVAAHSMITIIVLIMPTPGSAGIIEGSGYVFFSLFFEKSLLFPVILVWRMITYYSTIIVGGAVSVLALRKPSGKRETAA
ncbi:MAG: lysylphosphatidylglycerol synthase transmembrane domain-containing protein [Eubacteriales bacterium]|nr:lysylphosphatidylglycerol synthase transmembrane domain-containing protein [Eubacteriales bacterium]